MQPLSIAMNLLLGKAAVSPNSSACKQNSDSPAFSETLAEKISTNQTSQRVANAIGAGSNAQPRVSATNDHVDSDSSPRKWEKKSEPAGKNNGSTHTQVDVASLSQIIAVAPVVNTNIPVESVPVPPVQSALSPTTQQDLRIDPAVGESSQSFAASTVSRNVHLPSAKDIPSTTPSQPQIPTDDELFSSPGQLQTEPEAVHPTQQNAPGQATQAPAPTLPSSEPQLMSPVSISFPVNDRVAPNANAQEPSVSSSAGVPTDPAPQSFSSPSKAQESSKNEPLTSRRSAVKKQTIDSQQASAPVANESVALVNARDTAPHKNDAHQVVTAKVTSESDSASASTVHTFIGAASNSHSRVSAQVTVSNGQNGNPQDASQQNAAAKEKSTLHNSGEPSTGSAGSDDSDSGDATQTGSAIPTTTPTVATPLHPAPAQIVQPSNIPVATSVMTEHPATPSTDKDSRHDSPLADLSLRSSDLSDDTKRVPSITNAQISGNNGQSEVHLAMQEDKLGTIELHARVTGEQVGAAIVVEKKETHAALAVELPALQQALTDKNFRVEHVWLTQSAPHATAGDAGQMAQQQHSQNQYRPPVTRSGESDKLSSLSPLLPTESSEIFDHQGRLSVRA